MKRSIRFAPHFLVVLIVSIAVLATGGENRWLLIAVGVSIYVALGWQLWTTRGTIQSVVLVAIFVPILLPVAVLDWIRRRINQTPSG